jgi:hypothetical protein
MACVLSLTVFKMPNFPIHVAKQKLPDFPGNISRVFRKDSGHFSRKITLEFMQKIQKITFFAKI